MYNLSEKQEKSHQHEEEGEAQRSRLQFTSKILLKDLLKFKNMMLKRMDTISNKVIAKVEESACCVQDMKAVNKRTMKIE